jgi:hypothetical protein
VILSSSKSFLFLHVYKVAGSSVRRGLLPHANKGIVAGQAVNAMLQQLRLPAMKNPLYSYHPRLRDVRDALGADKFEKLFKFTFVRNPWDWQVSLYHYALQSPRHPQYDLMKSMADFDAYLDWRVNEDLKQQSDFVCDEDGKLLVDYLGHFETLNEDFKHVCEQIGIPCNLPFINQSKRRHYTEYYSDRGRALIEKAFAADIEKFGYRFDAT